MRLSANSSLRRMATLRSSMWPPASRTAFASLRQSAMRPSLVVVVLGRQGFPSAPLGRPFARECRITEGHVNARKYGPTPGVAPLVPTLRVGTHLLRRSASRASELPGGERLCRDAERPRRGFPRGAWVPEGWHAERGDQGNRATWRVR